jgi:vancomycin permeability regulator SanA
MSASRSGRQPQSHWKSRLLLFAAIGVLVYLVFISWQIVSESSTQDLRPADAIVVFGAAQYDGRPSPVFRARLDHAFELFERGLAPVARRPILPIAKAAWVTII